MTELAILADDLTGAADAAGAFAAAGFGTSIVFGDTTAASLDVIVRSTDSRALDADAAAATNTRAARLLTTLPASERPRWVYKKIDSALRGHIRRELLAVLAGLGETRALVAPALPVERRTTMASRQLIDGVPVDETALGGSAGTSDLRELLANDTLPVKAIGLTTVRGPVGELVRAMAELDTGILIADAETERDLKAIADAALQSGIRVLAGSAGLARRLATRLPQPATPQATARPLRQDGGVLIVAASQHAATCAQVEALRAAGVPVVQPAQTLLDGGNLAADPVANDVCAYLAEGRSVVLTTVGRSPAGSGPAFVRSLLASVVARIVERQRVGGLMLTGGDLASAVLQELGTSEIVLCGEMLPAMPWGRLRSPRLAEVPIVTKAGSFGERDALVRCLAFLLG